MRALVATLMLSGTLALAGCAAQPSPALGPAPLTVAAAASLRGAFEELAAKYEASGGGEVTFDFAASGVLQKQIEAGAPIDVFASASPKQVDLLVAGEFISAEETATFASNDLVVFVPKGNPEGIAGPQDLGTAQRLTTGNPETAPHGTKAREWLTGLGLWDGLAGRFAFAENSAQTLVYVERGDADAGIGFATEVRDSDKVEVAYTVPKGEIKPVRYVIAPVKSAKQPEAARRFVDLVLSAEGQAVLAGHGFLPAPAK